MNNKTLIAIVIIIFGVLLTDAEEQTVSVDKSAVATTNKSAGNLSQNVKTQESLTNQKKAPQNNPDAPQMTIPEYLIKLKYPQEYAAIKSNKAVWEKLKEQQMEALREKVRKDYKIESEKVHEMLSEYQKTKDPKILELIKAKLEEKYNAKTEYYKERLAKQEAWLQELQKRLDNARNASQSVIAQKNTGVNCELDNLCKNNFYWSMW